MMIMDLDELYGKPGIDTPYEREKITYRPHVAMSDQDRFYRIHPSTILRIERSKDFTISRSLIDYDALAKEIEELMGVIKERHKGADLNQYQESLKNGAHKEVIAWEDKFSGHRGTPDIEIYTMLARMKASVESRRDFLDLHYRNQITSDRHVDQVKQREEQSIDEWIQMEIKFQEIEEQIHAMYQDHGHDELYEEDSMRTQIAALEAELMSQDAAKKARSTFHTTLADTSYVHRNRYLMFKQVLEKAKQLVRTPQLILGDGVEELLTRLATLPDRPGAKSHLILSFREIKNNHTQLKGQFMMIDDQKEEFISKQQWFFQQLQVKSNQTLQDWLYNQDENGASAFQSFAGLIVGSMKTTGEKYQGSNAEILRFYQHEAVFYDDQMGLIQKKEELRRFLKILEDLEEAGVVTVEWAQDYLKAQGYHS
jgi:hypothetical protein